jgi:hypothetical protein
VGVADGDVVELRLGRRTNRRRWRGWVCLDYYAFRFLGLFQVFITVFVFFCFRCGSRSCGRRRSCSWRRRQRSSIRRRGRGRTCFGIFNYFFWDIRLRLGSV